MTATRSRAQREGVKCKETQEVVISVTEEMKQHLEQTQFNSEHKLS